MEASSAATLGDWTLGQVADEQQMAAMACRRRADSEEGYICEACE